MRLQRILGHLPALLHAQPRSVLIVGCGAGVTAGTFVVHPEVERITLCEIEPLIPPASARFFGRENHGVVHDRRTRIVFDDARHFVLTTPDRFDIITSDPIHPWVKGAATLYSKEYFEAVRAHLNPGGLVTQWVPLYDSDTESVRSEIATFFEVFPHAAIWGNQDTNGQGYDVVLLGSVEPIHVDLDAISRRMEASPRVADSLREVGFRSGVELFGAYTARPEDLRSWLAGAQINRDVSLRLQYLAGMAANQGKAPFIYGEIEKRGAFPADLFAGTPEQLAEVRKAFEDWRSW
jgi:spermidine synthase